MTWEGRVMSRCQMRRVWQRWWKKGRNWKKDGRHVSRKGYRQTCVRIMGFARERKANKPSWHLDEWDRYNVNVCQTSNYHVRSRQNFKGLIQYLLSNRQWALWLVDTVGPGCLQRSSHPQGFSLCPSTPTWLWLKMASQLDTTWRTRKSVRVSFRFFILFWISKKQTNPRLLV